MCCHEPDSAIARAEAYFDGGGFLNDLTRRVAIPSSSQEPERASALRSYLLDEIVPALTRLGFTCRLLETRPGRRCWSAERLENPHLVTALIYGHGDTIRGLDDLWRPGLAPWRVAVEGERIYGRGTADNKGQHSVNLGALAAVLEERGALGFNCKILLEMAEELGSVGLREVCTTHRESAEGRSPDRLGRSAHRAQGANDFSRCARRLSDRSARQPARRQPSLR